MQTSPSTCNGVNPVMIVIGSSDTARHHTPRAHRVDHDLRAFDQHSVVRMLMR
jgi:hypothetical protein